MTECNVEGCDHTARSLGKCPTHYIRAKQGKPTWVYCQRCSKKIKTGGRKWCYACREIAKRGK